MNTQITSQIAEIVKKRQPITDETKREKERLESLELRIRQLENMRQELIHLPVNNTELVEQLKEINFSKLLELIVQEQKVWENLSKRFARDTINVGVVGRTRQGKSTFLQKVSGLSNDEIPSSDRMPCTTVQSNIYHSQEDTYGMVHFHSETSFLEKVIAPYYKDLYSSPPNSLKEFCQTSPSILTPPSTLENLRDPAKAESVYNHLHDEYYANFGKYYQLLQPQERVERITKQQIKEYVSQGYNAESKPIFFSHFAVQKVEIFCGFPKIEVEKIGLVDMPGLGDTRLGDAERMIEALGQDVDFILFIRRPDNKGDLWKDEDIKLYDAAFQTLKGKLPLKDWSFMVLNYDGNNQMQCKDLENTRVNKGIHVAKCLTANCNNSDEANKVLEEVLIYLANNIVRLDRQYKAACQTSLKALQNAISIELEKASKALEQYGNEYAEYVKLRDQFFKELYDSIEKLRKQLRQEANQQNSDFKKQIDTAIDKCNHNSGIPLEEEIQSRANKHCIAEAYFWSIQNMRPNLLKNFHDLEVGLKESLDKKKSEVAEILIQLGLGGLTTECGTAFLEIVADKLPANLNSLKLGFQFISSFEVLYKGFIQSIVWEHISKTLPSDPNTPLSTPSNVNAILTDLNARHQDAVDNCKKALDVLAFSLTEIERSMIEEFADHITRAKGVEQEWDIFLGTIGSQIWPELRELEAHKQVQQEWMMLIDEAVSINQKLGS